VKAIGHVFEIENRKRIKLKTNLVMIEAMNFVNSEPLQPRQNTKNSRKKRVRDAALIP